MSAAALAVSAEFLRGVRDAFEAPALLRGRHKASNKDMPVMAQFSTGMVAELLGVPTHRVDYLLRDRKIRPTKGPTGAFHWSATEVLQAAEMLGLLTPELRSRLSELAEVGR